ncbi:MAG: hypothetical protein U9N38_01055 [Thermodesulfobacteriota bacterium]|nr:hypothetical protein [Thermodesulfobacteriota bacterium]
MKCAAYFTGLTCGWVAWINHVPDFDPVLFVRAKAWGPMPPSARDNPGPFGERALQHGHNGLQPARLGNWPYNMGVMANRPVRGTGPTGAWRLVRAVPRTARDNARERRNDKKSS